MIIDTSYCTLTSVPDFNDELEIRQPRVINEFTTIWKLSQFKSTKIALKMMLKNDICSIL